MRFASASSLTCGGALFIVLALSGFGPCTSQDELRAAEATRDALLASTKPKSEFWPEVERKGAAVKAEKVASAELAKVKAQNQALELEVATAEQRANDARSQRTAADSAFAEAKAALESARAESARRDATLEGFASRRRARGSS